MLRKPVTEFLGGVRECQFFINRMVSRVAGLHNVYVPAGTLTFVLQKRP